MILFEHVDKAYDLQAGRRTLVGTLKLMTNASASNDLFYALKDVSFQIGRGEAFGIIGRNGAGKSTILKLIAGITRPTRGNVTVNGRVSSLIELGAGFHPDLTGRENVFLSGAILGIPKRFIEDKFKEIVDFAELWDFIDVPVKKYSSGMYARLGFSVAVSVEPEILIIDEILSVGDVFFQQKCFEKMREIIKQGTTFIYVTHDTAGMQNLCDRALLLDAGRVEYLGGTTEAVSRYYGSVGQKAPIGRSAFQRSSIVDLLDDLASGGRSSSDMNALRAEICAHNLGPTARSAEGPTDIEILAVSFQNEHGEHAFAVEIMKSATVKILLRAAKPVSFVNAGFTLFDRMNNIVFSVGVAQRGLLIEGMKSGDEKVVTFRVQLAVKPGEYTFAVGAAETDPEDLNHGRTLHRLFGFGPVDVFTKSGAVYPFHGMAGLPVELTVAG